MCGCSSPENGGLCVCGSVCVRVFAWVAHPFFSLLPYARARFSLSPSHTLSQTHTLSLSRFSLFSICLALSLSLAFALSLLLFPSRSLMSQTDTPSLFHRHTHTLSLSLSLFNLSCSFSFAFSVSLPHVTQTNTRLCLSAEYRLFYTALLQKRPINVSPSHVTDKYTGVFVCSCGTDRHTFSLTPFFFVSLPRFLVRSFSLTLSCHRYTHWCRRCHIV